jgi:hypothetical protein
MVRAALVGLAVMMVAGGGQAHAAGGPSPGLALGGPGVISGALRYVAIPAPGGTALAQIDRSTGTVERFGDIRGLWGLPLVSWNDDVGGISADGARLVLAENPRGSGLLPARTRFAIVDPVKLRVRGVLSLRGAFSFDAISPDGRWLYLIQHTSARHITSYSVRVYDLLRDRLEPGAIVDQREPDERMAGLPVQRVSSADGAWAYTVYQKPTGAYFVHALDTSTRTAHCIDLPGGSTSAGRLSLSPDGSRLLWAHGARTTVIDTRTLRIAPAPTAHAAPAKPRHHPEGGGAGPGLVGIAAGLIAVIVAAGAALVRRRRPARGGSGGAAAGAPFGP